jgi:uncharacterized protein
MDIKHIESKSRGAFVIKKDHKRLAELTYKKDGDSINIDHTEVDKSLRGQGVGEDLVAAAVNFARYENIKVAASCPYANKVLRETVEYADVFSE